MIKNSLKLTTIAVLVALPMSSMAVELVTSINPTTDVTQDKKAQNHWRFTANSGLTQEFSGLFNDNDSAVVFVKDGGVISHPLETELNAGDTYKLTFDVATPDYPGTNTFKAELSIGGKVIEFAQQELSYASEVYKYEDEIVISKSDAQQLNGAQPAFLTLYSTDQSTVLLNNISLVLNDELISINRINKGEANTYLSSANGVTSTANHQHQAPVESQNQQQQYNGLVHNSYANTQQAVTYYSSAAANNPTTTANLGWVEQGSNLTTQLNVGIGTDQPSTSLEVNGNIIAADPTQPSHVVTLGYLENVIQNQNSTIAALTNRVKLLERGYISEGESCRDIKENNGNAQPGVYLISPHHSNTEPYLTYCDMSFKTYYQSCNEIKTDSPNSTSGMYKLFAGTHREHSAYCEMEVMGGGWTLVGNHKDGLLVQKVAQVSPSVYGVMQDSQWQETVRSMNTGFMTKDEHGRVSFISKAKLNSSNCKLSDSQSLDNPRSDGWAARIWDASSNGNCTEAGTVILLSDQRTNWNHYQTQGASLYNWTVKFDVWPYARQESNQEQNELLYFVK